MSSRYEETNKSRPTPRPTLQRTRSEEKIERLEKLEEKMHNAIMALEKLGEERESAVQSTAESKKVVKEKQKRGSNPWNNFCQKYYAKYGSDYKSYTDMIKSGDVSDAYKKGLEL